MKTAASDCASATGGWLRASAALFATATLGLLLLSSCTSPRRITPAVLKLDELPAPTFVPRDEVMPLAESRAKGSAGGFVFVNTTDELLPRYPAGTAFVAERQNYTDLRSGTLVILRRGLRRVARVLEQPTPKGWSTNTFDAMEEDTVLMQPNAYLGTVIQAFTPRPDDQQQ